MSRLSRLPGWSWFSWGCIAAAPISYALQGWRMHPAMLWWFSIHLAVVVASVYWRLK
jgi:hypothetical protein